MVLKAAPRCSRLAQPAFLCERIHLLVEHAVLRPVARRHLDLEPVVGAVAQLSHQGEPLPGSFECRGRTQVDRRSAPGACPTKRGGL
jgi:hypothetical protein